MSTPVGQNPFAIRDNTDPSMVLVPAELATLKEDFRKDLATLKEDFQAGLASMSEEIIQKVEKGFSDGADSFKKYEDSLKEQFNPYLEKK